MLQFKHLLALAIISVAMTTIATYVAFGHTPTPPPCAPLTIIKECGQQPTASQQAVFTMLVAGSIAFGVFAIVKNRARKIVAA